MISTKSKVYYKTRAALRTPGMRYIDDEGGARSSKTFTNIQILTEIAKVSKNLLISIASESMPHLKRGAIRDFQTIMADEWDEAAWNKSDCIYTFSNSGSVIEFFSVDQPGKVHGPARDILFLNEANHVPFETARQLFIRTRLFIIWDYNPAGEFWAHTNYAGRPDCVKVHSTYLDNCDPDTGQSFLTPEQIAEIESYKDDENWWRVYGRGELGRLEGLIFPDFQLIDELPAGGWDTEVYGMDFGYTNDPSVLVQLRINKGARRIWARQLFYSTRLLNDDMARLMEDAQVPRNALIFADCAEPKTIADLSRYGFNVLPCDKGRRKAEQLQLMKGYTLAVTKDSVEGIKELRGYTWAKDRAGKLLNEPIGVNDHFCFVGGTMIATENGEKRIDEIKPGEFVLTSIGRKKVLNTFDNGRKKILRILLNFCNFDIVIEATPDHLIKTTKGWKQLQQLSKGDAVFLLNDLTGNYTASTQGSDISHDTAGGFTASCGNTTTDQYRKGIISTIKTKIRQTTIFQTLNSSRVRNILQNILGKRCSEKDSRKNLCSVSTTLASMRTNGTVAKPDAPGTLNTRGSRQSGGKCGHISANVVARSSRREPCRAGNSAQTTANQNGGERITLTTSQKSAPGAGENLARINIGQEGFAKPVILQSISIQETRIERVFDLGIDGAHEYFANGVLSHNCDALRYGFVTYLANYGGGWGLGFV